VPAHHPGKERTHKELSMRTNFNWELKEPVYTLGDWEEIALWYLLLFSQI